MPELRLLPALRTVERVDKPTAVSSTRLRAVLAVGCDVHGDSPEHLVQLDGCPEQRRRGAGVSRPDADRLRNRTLTSKLQLNIKDLARLFLMAMSLVTLTIAVVMLSGCSDSTAPVAEAPSLTIQDYVARLNTQVDSLYRQGKTVRYGVINLCDSCPPYLVLQQTSK